MNKRYFLKILSVLSLGSLAATPTLQSLQSKANSNRRVVGWKLYYGDGKVISSKQKSWLQSPSDDVQLLLVFFSDTYRIWRDDHWEEENYRDMYFGRDYYWQFGNGQVLDIPKNVDVKLGKELSQEEWRAIYNLALQDRRWLQI